MAKQVVLDAKLDSAAAEHLTAALLGAQGDDITLDGSSVEHVGGLCLELLMSVRHLWAAEGRTVVVENPSEQMVDDLACFGLTAEDFQGRPA